MGLNKRIQWIDVAKGLGIILVVLGHCFNKDTVIHNWIFSFHMPLFFILSGYCFCAEKYTSLSEIVKSKSRSLLVPYFKFWIFAMILALLVPIWRSNLSIGDILTDLYCGYPSSLPITSIWFLIALFMCEVIFWVLLQIEKRMDKKFVLPCFLILSGLIGYMISVIKSIVYDPNLSIKAAEQTSVTFLPGNRLPLTLDTCMTAIVFFAMGYWLKKSEKGIMARTKKLTLSLILMSVNFIVAICLNSRVNLHGCTYGNGIYFYTGAVSGSLSVMYLAQFLCERGSKIRKTALKYFEFWGKNTLLVLGMQSLGVHISITLCNYFYQSNYRLYEDFPWPLGVATFLFLIFLFLPISYGINQKLFKNFRI